MKANLSTTLDVWEVEYNRHPPAFDPTNGMMFNSHRRNCFAPNFMRRPTASIVIILTILSRAQGATPNGTPTTGKTVAAWLPGGGRRRGGLPTIDGLPIYKRMNNQLTAYQMNSGEKTWSLPVGETPKEYENHPLLEGIDVPNSGGTGWSSSDGGWRFIGADESFERGYGSD